MTTYQQRRDMALAAVAREKIWVDKKPLIEIKSGAIVEWKKRNPQDYARNSKNLRSLAHWMLNYIRHNLTNYDKLMDAHAGKTPSAAIMIRNRVYGAIYTLYPMLGPIIAEQSQHKMTRI